MTTSPRSGLPTSLLPAFRLVVAIALAAAGCSTTPSAPAPTQNPGPTSVASAPGASASATPNRTEPPASPSPPPPPSPSPSSSAGSALVPGSVDRSTLTLDATYDVDLGVDSATGEIVVGTTIVARNASGTTIDRLELNTIAARLGDIDVTGASVDGRPVEPRVTDQTLVLPLGGILADGASITVQMAYRATLRADLDGSDWMFSRVGGTLALYRWIPWLSRAVPFDRPNHGDPFVTPSSPLVRVRVTTDVPLILASPGAEATRDGLRWTFEARDVRDVAVVLAPDFEVTTGDGEGFPIRAYTRPGGLDGDRLVAQAQHALTRMTDRLGVAYPWASFSVVETAGGYGMESPGLIWIPRGTPSANLPYLVHHETAHQWFYGLVGSDQQAEPFADEAPADLLARTILGLLRASRCDRAPLDRSIVRYSRACYYEVVYIQGGNVLDDIRASMGTDRFWTAMRTYLEAHRFGIGGTRELLESLRAASSVDLLPTLRSRFPDLY